MKRRGFLRCFVLAGAAFATGRAQFAGATESDDFFHAIDVDNAGGVSRLLDKGFDPNARDAQGQTALCRALIQESPRATAVLWAATGIDLDAANANGETPLMLAALRGNLPAMRYLLAHGAKPHQRGWSALHYAATNGDVNEVRLMLEQGAPVDARSPNGSTPLMMAARYGSDAAADLLLAQGADAALRNDKGLSAADFALAAGRDKLAARLKVKPVSTP